MDVLSPLHQPATPDDLKEFNFDTALAMPVIAKQSLQINNSLSEASDKELEWARSLVAGYDLLHLKDNHRSLMTYFFFGGISFNLHSLHLSRVFWVGSDLAPVPPGHIDSYLFLEVMLYCPRLRYLVLESPSTSEPDKMECLVANRYATAFLNITTFILHFNSMRNAFIPLQLVQLLHLMRKLEIFKFKGVGWDPEEFADILPPPPFQLKHITLAEEAWETGAFNYWSILSSSQFTLEEAHFKFYPNHSISPNLMWMWGALRCLHLWGSPRPSSILDLLQFCPILTHLAVPYPMEDSKWAVDHSMLKNYFDALKTPLLDLHLLFENSLYDQCARPVVDDNNSFILLEVLILTHPALRNLRSLTFDIPVLHRWFKVITRHIKKTCDVENISFYITCSGLRNHRACHHCPRVVDTTRVFRMPRPTKKIPLTNLETFH